MAEGSAQKGVVFCTLNDKGQKQFQKRIKAASDKTDPAVGEYEKAKLPAHKAAFDGNVPALEGIFITQVKNGGISIADKGISPIHMAIKGNKMDSVKWLIKFTTNSITAQTKDGKTPVHLAIEQGNLECLKVLLGTDEKGAKAAIAAIEEKSGLTCLLFSIQRHQNAAFKYLLNELGSKTLTVPNSSGVTAAHVAASAGNFEVLKMLASKHKKMLQEKTTDGCTPVYFSTQEGQLEALSYLHETCKVSLSDEPTTSQGYQGIHAAVRGGHINIVEYLVTNVGPQVLHLKSKDGSTPLHIAASVGDHEMCRWIVSYDSSGSVLKAVDASKGSPAHNAAESEHSVVLKFLLENGADPDLANKKGDTPTTIALRSKKQNMIEVVTKQEQKATATTLETDKLMIDPLYDSIDNTLNTEKGEEKEERVDEKEKEETAVGEGADMTSDEVGKEEEVEDEFKPEQEPIYSVPDPEVISKKRQSVLVEDEPPPVPEQNFEEEKKEEVTKKPLKKTSSVLQKWPHKDEPSSESDDHKPRLKPTRSKIMSAWPPPKEEERKTEVVSVGSKKKWPPEPEVQEPEKEEEEKTKEEEMVAEDEKPEEIKEEPLKQSFVKLRRTIREPKPEENQVQENEFQSALHKLKKHNN